MRKLNIHIKNLIIELEKEGIKFYFDQTITKKLTLKGLIDSKEDYVEVRLENVVFEKNSKKFKIYEPLFFRDFGQCKYFKQTRNGGEFLDLDDETYYKFQKIIILKWFEKNLSK